MKCTLRFAAQMSAADFLRELCRGATTFLGVEIHHCPTNQRADQQPYLQRRQRIDWATYRETKQGMSALMSALCVRGRGRLLLKVGRQVLTWSRVLWGIGQVPLLSGILYECCLRARWCLQWRALTGIGVEQCIAPSRTQWPKKKRDEGITLSTVIWVVHLIRVNPYIYIYKSKRMRKNKVIAEM